MVSMSKTNLARPLAWSIAALSLTLTVAGLALSLLALVQSAGQRWLAPHLLLNPVTTVTYALVGALIASRHPRNPIGWIFSMVGVLFGLTFISFSYRMAGQSYAMTLPGIEIARWLDMWVWIPASILPLTFLLLLFPDGRLPSARWRPIGWSAGLGMVAYTLGIALHPRPPIEPNPSANPFGIPGAAGALDLLLSIAFPLLAIGAFGSLAALVVRFRRSRGIEREQLKWLAYAGGLAILGSAVSGVLVAVWPDDPMVYELGITISVATLVVVGIAAGIAILRYRLYDIDLLINRTLVYGALSAGVVGLYVLLVGSLGALFQSSGNLVIALLATGLVAILFQPLRARLQRGVNRLMYGERDDPYTVLSRLGQQLKTTLAPTAVLPNIVRNGCADAQAAVCRPGARERQPTGNRCGVWRARRRPDAAAARLPGRDGRPAAGRAARARRSVHAGRAAPARTTSRCRPASPPTPCA